MVSVQKRLENTNNILCAFTIDNGMAIGSKKAGGCIVEAVVILKGNEDGTTTLYINQDKLDELNGNVVYKNLADEL